MQIEFALPLNTFDAPLVKAAFEMAIERFDANIAEGVTHPWQHNKLRLQNLLQDMALAEAEALNNLSRPPDKD